MILVSVPDTLSSGFTHYYLDGSTRGANMETSRVDALLAKLEQNKNNLELTDLADFREQIADFTVAELLKLAANLDRAISTKTLMIH